MPRPTLADVDDLVERVRAAGVPVTFSLTGAATTPPEIVQLTAYRIVREALTSVLKHAGPGARASVLVATDPSQVSVDVIDDGVGGQPGTTGLGLRGMNGAQRCSGASEAGPGRSGGFHVHAVLPTGKHLVITVLLVDDQAGPCRVRDARWLAADLTVVGEAGDGLAVRAVRTPAARRRAHGRADADDGRCRGHP